MRNSVITLLLMTIEMCLMMQVRSKPTIVDQELTYNSTYKQINDRGLNEAEMKLLNITNQRSVRERRGTETVIPQRKITTSLRKRISVVSQIVPSNFKVFRSNTSNGWLSRLFRTNFSSSDMNATNMGAFNKTKSPISVQSILSKVVNELGNTSLVNSRNLDIYMLALKAVCGQPSVMIEAIDKTIMLISTAGLMLNITKTTDMCSKKINITAIGLSPSQIQSFSQLVFNIETVLNKTLLRHATNGHADQLLHLFLFLGIINLLTPINLPDSVSNVLITCSMKNSTEIQDIIKTSTLSVNKMIKQLKPVVLAITEPQTPSSFLVFFELLNGLFDDENLRCIPQHSLELQPLIEPLLVLVNSILQLLSTILRCLVATSLTSLVDTIKVLMELIRSVKILLELLNVLVGVLSKIVQLPISNILGNM